jgi:NAD(P)-dependent dehydrogenase (short-subunit alcohol dehydrogenase family)
MPEEVAVIVGAGPGLSASLARLCARDGFRVALAARNPGKLAALCAETGARAYPCDVADETAVAALFEQTDRDLGPPGLVVFNASDRARGPVAELDPARVRQALLTGCFGGFLVGREAARRMLERGGGTILFTGATASVKGFAGSAGFAMPKFGLRGLAQSMARELAGQNIHVAHIVIDGAIATSMAGRGPGDGPPDRFLEPDAIAETYLHLHRQHRSAWSWEVEVRPWVERF